MKRQIIKIDQRLCNGCGECIPNCPEGAIQIIDGKARLVSDLFCDGLGACLGHCPLGAITTENREAEPYNEKIVMANIVKQGENTIKAHLEHLDHHGETELYQQAIEFLQEHNFHIPDISSPETKECDCGSAAVQEKYNEKIGPPSSSHSPPDSFKIPKIIMGCLGARSLSLNTPLSVKQNENESPEASQKSELRNWPIQIRLFPLQAQYFNNADVLIAADCVAGSYPNFHRDFVKEHTLMMGCPKFDDSTLYIEKLTKIFELNTIQKVKIVLMEVPCCSGLVRIVKTAMERSGKESVIPIQTLVVTSSGQIKK